MIEHYVLLLLAAQTKVPFNLPVSKGRKSFLYLNIGFDVMHTRNG
jgi:hypothetical protein